MAKHRWRGLMGLVLMLLSSSALALGLGEIRVKSGPGQPLVAEIPIISSEPGELEQLRAELASPATFERVGLPRPQGVVNDLDFAVALDDAGRPIIRVTSRTPVDVPVVNFLISVDWGQGRLVREYAAMVDRPGSVAAASQPYIEAPQAAPSDVIARPAEPLAAAPAAEVEPPPEPAPQGAAPVTAATPSNPGASAPAAQVALDAGDTYTVRRGQTLSQIAQRIGGAQSVDQTMISLLRANPDAFIRNNINQLRQGAVLRIPAAEEIARLDESEAAALVRSQIDDWRQARRPIPQPAAIAAPTPAQARASAHQTAQARLEIAPPLASAATRAGTQSGVDAGGEGDMLANEQLQQSREDLAARESEVQELRAQVAELEKLKQQQDKLIAMKDSDLAAAQQRLAQSNGATEAGTPIWAWAGWGLLILGALAWLLVSRRRRVAPAPAPRSRVLGEPAVPAAPAAAPLADEDFVAPESVPFPAPSSTRVNAAESIAQTATGPSSAPAIHPAPTVPPSTSMRTPTWHSGDGIASVAPLNAAPAGRERLELAIAYLDLGDTVTARDLLNEVVAGNDDGAREQALQLLRDIG